MYRGKLRSSPRSSKDKDITKLFPKFQTSSMAGRFSRGLLQTKDIKKVLFLRPFTNGIPCTGLSQIHFNWMFLQSEYLLHPFVNEDSTKFFQRWRQICLIVLYPINIQEIFYSCGTFQQASRDRKFPEVLLRQKTR